MEPLTADDPRTIGDYRLLRRLGAGGMGRVYLGRSPGGRTVAVKVVHAHFAADTQFRERFRREIAAARRVGGEWTAPVLDADAEAPTPWVATGYVAGPALAEAVGTHGPLAEHTVRALGAGLGEALVAVHLRDLVHRDVKPSNVMLTLDGPRLIDFGISRAMDSTASLTGTGVSIGSPGYMSPEQVLGRDVQTATDVFSMGAVLAFAATGLPPFSGDNSATLLYKVVHEEPELHDLDGELRDLVAACLAKEAADRPTATEAARLLSGGEGAAALMTRGWLPAPVVEGVSRRAVELLELEAEPPPGPVPQPSPSPPPSAYSGTFGPPDPSYGGGWADRADTPADPRTFPLGGRAASAHTAGSGTPGSATPAATGPQRGGDAPARGRRRSALVVAAVAAVVLLAGGLYFLPLEGDNGDSTAGGTTSGSTSGNTSGDTSAGTSGADAGGGSGGDAGGDSGAGESSGSGGDSGSGGGATDEVDDSGGGKQAGAVPKAFLGTWKGSVTTANFGVSSTYEITIEGGGVGKVVARDSAALGIAGFDCSGDYRLVSATSTTLVLDSSGSDNPHPGICSDGSDKERFTLRGNGSLHYESGDTKAGNPRGDLTKQD
ncbi:serine/threonine-protein kinase [Streptomyces sp. 549]|uniref:serine/threonine-protein kinase n=1 Tax=Streptomyces sp. 549 TaxID=3049076 RepID=UPI0024C211D5|nr:serine/threonine-protein kinase [Streptomyces sp. 549]MDK1475321.1 serine/threonine-protein kinase [Streptomyces sp. 549]